MSSASSGQRRTGRTDAEWTIGGTFYDLSSSVPNGNNEVGLVWPSYSIYDFLALTYDGSQIRFYVNANLMSFQERHR